MSSFSRVILTVRIVLSGYLVVNAIVTVILVYQITYLIRYWRAE